jgi:hypothetical protein
MAQIQILKKDVKFNIIESIWDSNQFIKLKIYSKYFGYMDFWNELSTIFFGPP